MLVHWCCTHSPASSTHTGNDNTASWWMDGWAWVLPRFWILPKKGVPRFLAIQVDKIMVLPQLALKYLAIMIDIKMNRFTKLISRHGYFQFYLHTIGKWLSSGCIYWKNEVEDACRPFFLLQNVEAPQPSSISGRASCVFGHHNCDHVAKWECMEQSGRLHSRHP